SAQSVATIYSGRKQLDVTNAFTANSAVPGVAATNPVWDTTVPLPATQALFITPASITQSGTKYDTTVLAGSCYQPRAGGDCAKPAKPGYVALIRVIVIVRWTATQNCPTGGCFYSATTLVDPSQELAWVTNG
ncbi:MAG: hypothetical protein ABI400_08970, partial [Lacisediminihabitans sp.]